MDRSETDRRRPIDAFLIRMTLIPALMSLIGHPAWYPPRALDRVLPNVDLEGAALPHHKPTPTPAHPLPQAA